MPNKPMRGAQVNLAHHLSRGLTNAYIMNEGQGDTTYDSLNLNTKDHEGTLVGPVWTSGVNGPGLDFDGSNDRVKFGQGFKVPNNKASTLSELTIAVDCIVDDMDVQDQRLFTKQDSNQVANHDWMMGTTSATPTMRVRLNAGGSTTTLIGNANRLVLGERAMWFLRYGFIDEGGKVLAIFKNGELDQSVSKTGDVGQATDRDVFFGCGITLGVEESFLDGKIFGVYFWNRSLGIGEMARFSMNPYQIFDFGMNPALFGQLLAVPNVNTESGHMRGYLGGHLSGVV